MKLTPKQLMFILMSSLLVLVVVMGAIVLGRIGNLLNPVTKPIMGNNTKPSVSQNGSTDADVPPPSSSVAPTGTVAVHHHEHTIKETYSATCETGGYTLLRCECGHMTTDVDSMTPALGHKYGTATVVAATCTEDGWTERTCSRCNRIERTNPTKAGHTFGPWEETVVAVGTAINEQRTCDGCDLTEVRSLDTEKTWTVFTAPQEALDAFAYYQITLHLEGNEKDTVLDVYLGLTDCTLEFDYTETGLVIYYTVDGNAMNYPVPADTKLVTIAADGSVTNEKPVVDSTPDDPDNPETPDNPDNPETPDQPDIPETTGPSIPETTGPVIPETTGPAATE